MFRGLIDKLFFNGLDAARDLATRRIVARFSRGNVTVQDGRYQTEADLDRLRTRGDRAWARVRAQARLAN